MLSTPVAGLIIRINKNKSGRQVMKHLSAAAIFANAEKYNRIILTIFIFADI